MLSDQSDLLANEIKASKSLKLCCCHLLSHCKGKLVKCAMINSHNALPYFPERPLWYHPERCFHSLTISQTLLIYKTCKYMGVGTVNCQFAHLVMSGEGRYQVFIYRLPASCCGLDWEDTASVTKCTNGCLRTPCVTTTTITNGFY